MGGAAGVARRALESEASGKIGRNSALLLRHARAGAARARFWFLSLVCRQSDLPQGRRAARGCGVCARRPHSHRDGRAIPRPHPPPRRAERARAGGPHRPVHGRSARSFAGRDRRAHHRQLPSPLPHHLISNLKPRTSNLQLSTVLYFPYGIRQQLRCSQQGGPGRGEERGRSGDQGDQHALRLEGLEVAGSRSRARTPSSLRRRTSTSWRRSKRSCARSW